MEKDIILKKIESICNGPNKIIVNGIDVIELLLNAYCSISMMNEDLENFRQENARFRSKINSLQSDLDRCKAERLAAEELLQLLKESYGFYSLELDDVNKMISIYMQTQEGKG